MNYKSQKNQNGFEYLNFEFFMKLRMDKKPFEVFAFSEYASLLM